MFYVGAMVWRVFKHGNRTAVRILHGTLHVLALIIALLGLFAAWRAHDIGVSNPSLHPSAPSCPMLYPPFIDPVPPERIPNLAAPSLRRKMKVKAGEKKGRTMSKLIKILIFLHGCLEIYSNSLIFYRALSFA